MRHTPILSSDGDAIERLQAQVEKCEKVQARMKLANGIIKKLKGDNIACIAALEAEGFERPARLLEPDYAGRIGFPDYELTNNNANIRRLKQRIEKIGRLQATPATETEGTNGIRFEDAPQDNRVRLFFPGKPDTVTRSDLKRSGFRWTPTLGCWQAYRNWGSIAKAKSFLCATETLVEAPKQATAAKCCDDPIVEGGRCACGAWIPEAQAI